MNKKDHIATILTDFVFRDCRLGSHPGIVSHIFWKQGDNLVLGYSSSISNTASEGDIISNISGSITARAFREGSWGIDNSQQPSPKQPSSRFVMLEQISSMLATPIMYDKEVMGVLSLSSREQDEFTEKDLGLSQLLAAILVYVKIHIERRIPQATSASRSLGEALRRIREEVGLTQAELADKLGQSRIALSRWEGGAQPPSIGPLYKWCKALGLMSDTQGALVKIIDITTRLLEILRQDPNRIRDLSPERFEHLIAERLDAMGFDVTLTGPTSLKDGGIDLVAIPKVRSLGGYLLAGQVKHHTGNQRTGRIAVDRLLAWKSSQFRLALLATNTSFTKDARWLADQEIHRSFLRLRDFDDLRRWIEGNFWSEEEWREIPDQILLAPNVTVKIPRARLESSLEIWPISKLKK